MVSQNITDYELYTDSSNNRIIVRFPWKSDETNFDPEEAINELSATAQLTFRKGMSTRPPTTATTAASCTRPRPAPPPTT